MLEEQKLRPENKRLLKQKIKELERDGRLAKERLYYQHGTTTVFEHSVKVAVMSLLIAQVLPFKVNMPALVCGALLHDYFLYDWHEKDESHRLHGFFHAGKALENAQSDYDLGEIEKNIIKRHMFPLNPAPPGCREAWIVCIADKYCAARETADGFFGKGKRD